MVASAQSRELLANNSVATKVRTPGRVADHATRLLLHLPGSPSASEAITRAFARFIGTGAAFFAIILAPHIVSQSHVLSPWSTPVILIVTFTPLVALIPASFAGDLRYIAWLGSLSGVGWLLGGALWIIGLKDDHIPTTQDVWLSTFPAIAAMATAFAWRVSATVAYLIASSVLAQVLHFVSRPSAPLWTLLPESIYIVAFCSLFVVATIVALRTGAVLDQAIANAREQAASAAEAEARHFERRRFESFVHDKLMSTLLALAREGTTDDLADRARRTMRDIDDLEKDVWQDPPLTLAAACSLIRKSIATVSVEIPIFETVESSARTVRIPSRAAHAIAVAAAEAANNSLRHAGAGVPGRCVEHAVDLYADAEQLELVIADNGRGFDWRDVTPDRLGIASSIVAGMSEVDGCVAKIDSRVGRGTFILLSWRP